MRLNNDSNTVLDPKITWRREVVFMLLAGIFLGCLTMLNILGITRFIDLSALFNAAPNTFMVAVGVLAYPVTFLCTDFISELYGKRRANLIVWVGLVLNIWVLFMLWLGGALPPYVEYCTDVGYLEGVHVGDAICPVADVPPVGTSGRTFFDLRHYAFGATLASMIAYLAAQFTDVQIFHWLKKKTKGKHLWLRNNGSTLVSQLVDTTAVICITYLVGALPPPQDGQTLAGHLLLFIITGYVFKLVTALLDTIPFYFGVRYLKRYLAINEEEFEE